MNRIFLFCALGALWGCRAVTEPTTEAITLSYSTSEGSKTDALTAGDEVAVFACIAGTETYFLEAEKFITGSDGKTLTATPAIYYPEPKQAVNFYAYVPYHTGTFSVPTDQSTAAALKQADLCWTNASSTPVATPVSLTFQHLFARLIVQTNQPTEKIACLVVPSGVLNAATAQFTLTGGKSEVFTTGNELIFPVQPLSRLIITVSGVEYVFEGSINLQAGQTTTLNLTLHPNTQTATLNGSSTTPWTASNQSGGIAEAVSNILSLHWPKCPPETSTANKAILKIKDLTSNTITDYTVTNGITYADKTFSVPFSSTSLHYPYLLTEVSLYNGATMLHLGTCKVLVGPTIYKAGSTTVGIRDIPNTVYINGLFWTTGNLVADGPNGCKIGTPTDCGLYFHFGSLIGWSGGVNGDGTGGFTTAIPGGTTIKVNPTGYLGSQSYPGPYYVPATGGTGYCLPNTDITATGMGDPCRYYLGAAFRTPTTDQYSNLIGEGGSNTNRSIPLTVNNTTLWFLTTGIRDYRQGSGFQLNTAIYHTSSYVNPYPTGLEFGSTYADVRAALSFFCCSIRCVAQ